MDQTIRQGSIVRLHYVMAVDGRTIADSRQGEPAVVTIGARQVLAGLEQALIGKSKGEAFSVEIPPDLAFGTGDSAATKELPLSDFLNAKDLRVGGRVQIPSAAGLIPAVVTAVTDKAVTVDTDHPLAGKTVSIRTQILDVVPPAVPPIS